jgi:FkbM family methyltransferase
MISDVDASDLLRMQRDDNQVFENIITRIYIALLQPGDICLDGGACDGLHTFRLARFVGSEGTVFAVEPIPSVAHKLESALAARGLHNVSVIRGALYHERGKSLFNVVTNALTRSGIAKVAYAGLDPVFEEIEVVTVLIDDILGGVDSWRFCKLDLEGCEFRALQGARDAIERHSPFIVFEWSVAAPDAYGYTPEEFAGFFRELDYETFDLFGRPLSIEDGTTPGRPWYALAVRSASDDEVFVHARLPAILHNLLETERAPITTSSQRPPTDGPFIWAVPNPVPGGPGLGETVVHWDTGDGTMGEVYLSVNWERERIFFRGPRGCRAAPWLHASCNYEFRLYRGRERGDLLGTVTVTRRRM